MNDSEAAPVVYYDRSTGLTVFGILTIGLGCLCGLLLLLVIAGQLVTAAMPQTDPNLHPVPLRTLTSVFVMYGGLAVALVWLGVGSMMAQRWARALMLIFSWSWLILGTLMVLMMALMLPMMSNIAAAAAPSGHQPPPAGAMASVFVVMLLFESVLLIVLPAVWIFFYGSPNVRATCESRHPAPSWTDACPLPVLAVCIWAVVSGPLTLVSSVSSHTPAAFFGMFLTGPLAITAYLVIAGVWIFSAGLMYRLDVRGWWLMLAGLVLGVLSSALTFAHHDISEMYQLMNLPPEQLEQMKKFSFFSGSTVVWMTLACAAPIFGYLLFIKRYFRRG